MALRFVPRALEYHGETGSVFFLNKNSSQTSDCLFIISARPHFHISSLRPHQAYYTTSSRNLLDASLHTNPSRNVFIQISLSFFPGPCATFTQRPMPPIMEVSFDARYGQPKDLVSDYSYLSVPLAMLTPKRSLTVNNMI